MSNFNWQTEDDVNWDDLEPVRNTAVSRRRPWLTYLLIVMGVVTAVTLIYRQVNQRVETATTNATNDILASHNLVHRASAEQDIELLKSLLSGRDPGWVEAQNDLIEQGSLFDRAGLGLVWRPQNTAVTLDDIENDTAQIEISPELNAAELTFLQEYVIAVGNGLTETVQLQHTAVYRIGTERWLYAPPDDDFWRSYETISGEMLTMAYPARDVELAQRLFLDLDAKLVQLCRSLSGFNCPANFRLRVRLENDASSLVALAQPYHTLQSGWQLNLPTPTLVGRPLDETSYQALYRGYAARMVEGVILRLVGYECCDHLLFFQALTDYQLSQLGLRDWPVTAVHYSRMVREGVDSFDLVQLWQNTDPDDLSRWQVETAVDFILNNFPQTSAADLQRLLAARTGFAKWLADANVTSSDTENSPTFDQMWYAYAFQQISANQPPQPIPWPKQDIFLACSDPTELETYFQNLYRLDLDSLSWTEVLTDLPAYYINPLPQNDGLIIQSFGTDDQTPTLTLWRTDNTARVIENDSISVGQLAPDGRLLAYGIQGEIMPHLLDAADCDGGFCWQYPLAGLPVWSPDGTDFIMLPEMALVENQFAINDHYYLFEQADRPAAWPLHRGGGVSVTGSLNEMTYIGSGYAAFWLNETTYGFVQPSPTPSVPASSAGHELVIGSIWDDQFRPVFTEDDLVMALPEGERPSSRLTMHIVTPRPHHPDELFIWAADPLSVTYFFSYNIATDQITFHFRTQIIRFHSLGMDPNGRFLTLAATMPTSQINAVNQLFLYDTADQQIEQFRLNGSSFAPANVFDWSADGQWLAVILDDLGVALTAPAYNYHQFIPHDFGECTNVIWLNE